MNRNKSNIQGNIEEFVQNNSIFLLTTVNNTDLLPLDNIQYSFYYTIKSRDKNCRDIIDFYKRKIKTRTSFQDLNESKKLKYEEIIHSIIDKFNSEVMTLNEFQILSFSRYQNKFFYYDYILIFTEKNTYLLTAIHLAQFVEFDEEPESKKAMKFHEKFRINISKNNIIELKDIKFSVIYGKSTQIGFLCISIGIVIIVFSLLGIFSILSIYFGIFAIIGGLLWFFPIK